MSHRVFKAALAALTLTTAGWAAPLSVLDPPVTINAVDTRLSSVLNTLSAQTGVAFGGMMPGGPGGNLDWMPEEQRERVDPKISLKAEARPLLSLIHI